jgi:hypothetical protein
MKQFLFAATLLLAGCAAELPHTTANLAIAGAEPSFEQCKNYVYEYLMARAKDPHSAQDVAIGAPELWRLMGAQAEWRIPFKANLKNSFGAYTGIQLHYVFIKNGQIDWQRDQMISNLEEIQRSL